MDAEEANRAPLEFPLSAVFAYPDAGYDAERERVGRLLRPGEVYQVTGLQVGQSDSWLELYGYRGERFSTVFFAPYWELPEEGDPEPGPRVAADPDIGRCPGPGGCFPGEACGYADVCAPR